MNPATRSTASSITNGRQGILLSQARILSFSWETTIYNRALGLSLASMTAMSLLSSMRREYLLWLVMSLQASFSFSSWILTWVCVSRRIVPITPLGTLFVPHFAFLWGILKYSRKEGKLVTKIRLARHLHDTVLTVLQIHWRCLRRVFRLLSRSSIVQRSVFWLGIMKVINFEQACVYIPLINYHYRNKNH